MNAENTKILGTIGINGDIEKLETRKGKILQKKNGLLKRCTEVKRLMLIGKYMNDTFIKKQFWSE